MKIDAHQHFWRYTPADYDWIDDAMSVIRRDFLPADSAHELASAGIDGSVAVQARQTLAETDWLLELAAKNPLIKGVVGWVPLRDHGGAAVGELLDHYTRFTAFKGVRHVLQVEPNAYFADADFNAGLREVTARSLTYDLLILARQLPVALAFVDRHPAQRIVLDHIAKPAIVGTPPAEWVRCIRELARREHVFCKFSGLVTEVRAADWPWRPGLLRPYFDIVLEAFGPERLMFGSDWPVCLVASDYRRWHDFVAACVTPLSPTESAAILGGNAVAFYRLTPTALPL